MKSYIASPHTCERCGITAPYNEHRAMPQRIVVLSAVLYGIAVGVVYGLLVIRATTPPPLPPAEPVCHTVSVIRFCAPQQAQAN